MSQKLNTAIAVIGIDIGKNSFHVVGLDKRGAIVLRQKWSRGQVETRLANMPPCLIGMEACVGAHHLSRKLKGLGHDARLMPAKYVRPYSKGQKNDFRDAEAIAEAVQRPTMKFVATKTADQLDLQALHRVLVGRDRGHRPPRCRLRAADERAGDRADHLQRDGGCHWQWRCVRKRPRLRRLAGARPQADLDWGSHDPRQDIDGSSSPFSAAWRRGRCRLAHSSPTECGESEC